MVASSRASSIKVSFVQAFGPQDAAHVASYANTLVQWRCDVIVAAPGAPAAAVEQVAPANPGLRFVVVGAVSTGPNVAPLPGGGDVAARVQRMLTAAEAGHYTGWATGSAGAS
jgi:basic membrane lipoprotein Med (substrate-binding protein (PBP1-ABC) superfamily)